MKKFYLFQLLVFLSMIGVGASAQTIHFPDSWGQQGFNIISDNDRSLKFIFSVPEFSFNEFENNGELMKSITLPGVFLPNKEGAPDLPLMSRFIAIPNGAQANIRILSSRAELLEGENIAPAPVIPLDTDRTPMKYIRDLSIYSKNAFYPESPVNTSEVMNIRGVTVLPLSITPFQYNPVTKQLKIYTQLEIEITFTGGNGTVGDERLRSRYWDPILYENTLNKNCIPAIEYDKRYTNVTQSDASAGTNFEYLIITPDQADFRAWADSIRLFRNLQGIRTGVVTTTEIGGNTVTAIESFIDNAYNTWSIPPAAILLLGDYGSGSTTIISPLVPHPSGYPDFASDNIYADVNNDDLPDIILSRIAATDAAQLKVMVSKFINYERNPPSKASFYSSPITALGWQTERWFQLCSEVVGGYFRSKQGKIPVRINAVYSGNPTLDPWSTASNTTTILNYFGPSGRAYIPATPQELGGFSGGTTSNVVTAINNGSFFLLHRDHGYYQGWGEPAFSTSSVNSLRNINNELPFVFSINCQTGAYQGSSECLAEKFHRYSYNGQNSGALGVIAPTEVSYSFLNDTYLWGVFDNLFPDFMPDNVSSFASSFVRPAFANAAGKYFLFQSGWSGYGGVYKQTTYRLFHCHGDAFGTLYTQVPQVLAVTHPTTITSTATSLSVTANAGAFIALTLDGNIIGTATSSGSPVILALPALSSANSLVVTVTKQNYYRYSSKIEINSGTPVANFAANVTTTCAGATVSFSDQSLGSPTSWAWSFPGGNPATSTLKNPSAIYSAAGTYNVSLTVTNNFGSNTKTLSGYITVINSQPQPAFTADNTSITTGGTVVFTDQSTNFPSSWTWSFPGGTPSVSSSPVQSVTYANAGTYPVTLTVSNCAGAITLTKSGYVEVKNASVTYCASAGLNWSTEWISKVELGSFANASGAAGYSDFTSRTIQVTSGTSVPVKLYPSFSGSSRREFWKVWIDFNQNGSFTDVGEEVYSASGLKTIATGSITIANIIGNLRMRVAMKYNAAPSPCETFQYGEVEDYILTVVQSASQPPVADFSAVLPEILTGQSVQFVDNSVNNPTSWQWSFPGGSPSASSMQNPSVVYGAAGSYNVSLTVSNSNGSNTLTKTGYIVVTNPNTQYCASSALSNAAEWISNVSIGTYTNNSGASGYSDFTQQSIALAPGTTYTISLIPGFSGSVQKEFWRIWIDYNGDLDFDDAGEAVFSANNQRGAVNSNLTIPAGTTGNTRMRVSMKNGSAPTACETFNGGEVEDYTVTFITEKSSADAGRITLYPNPASDRVYFNTIQETLEILLTGPDGKQLKKQQLNAGEFLDISELEKGIYFITLLNTGSHQVFKVIKN